VTDWHVPDDVMALFVAEPRAVDDVTAASIEQHVEACGRCQHVAAASTPEIDLDRVWAEVADRVDQDGAGLGERLLRRLGVAAGEARLVAATRALQVGAVIAVAVVVAVLVWASRAADAGGVFLALAPIVPTALVAASFAPGADPAGECGLATPVYGFGLVLRRAVSVEALALVVLVVGSLLVPVDGPRAVAWLLPAAALSLGTMAASVRWPAPHAALGLLAVWFGGMTVSALADHSARLVDAAVFGPAGQVAAALVVAASVAVVVTHRQVLFQEAAR
jgi:hypothetical protein